MIIEMHPPKFWNEMQTFKRSLVMMAQEGLDCRDALALGYFPAVKGNPFQDLLYCAANELGVVIQPVSAPIMPRMRELGARPILHLHWVHRLLGGITREKDALNRIARIMMSLRQQQQQGVRIIWTVHNLQSHRSRLPYAEANLRRELARVSDIIHVMNPATRALYSEIADLDERKILSVPHPSYEGTYDQSISRADARAHFGLSEDQPTLLAFGKLQRQKGLRRLIEAFIRAQGEHFAGRAVLIIAGEPVEPDFVRELQALALRDDIKLITQRIQNDQVAQYFKAADAVVCPYEQSLNSGVAVTASSMERVLLLRKDLAGSFQGHDHVVVMEHISSEALRRAVERAKQTNHEKSFGRWAHEHQPHRVSRQFLSQIRERIEL